MIALATAVAAWSLSPLLIYQSSGIAKPPILALYAVALGALMAAVAMWAARIANPYEFARKVVQRGWLPEAVLVGLAAFVVYPLLYFSAIQGGPPVAVNLVNYLWPIVAVIVVAVWRPSSRSLETILAAGFGFAGAGLAITADPGGQVLPVGDDLTPFLLAALGAVAYGGATGAIRLRHPRSRADSADVFVAALLIGGLVAWVFIAALALLRPDLIEVDLSAETPWALLLYAVLLPVAHLSWMTAIKDQKLPAFTSAFLVPVFSTGVLALVLSGAWEPEVLSALVLVLCGITFASVHDRGVPVGYAVALAFLSSIQVSQILAAKVEPGLTVEVGVLSELIAATSAIFAGFILNNAIQRNGALHTACGRFYARAAKTVRGGYDLDAVLPELDALDARVILDARPRTPDGPVRPQVNREFAVEWSNVDVAVSNRVSGYEWLVLLVGGGSLMIALHAYGVASTSEVMILLRAMAVSLVVGILFAVRDYDRRRPELLCRLLGSFRIRHGFPVDDDSPLAVSTRHWSRKVSWPFRLGLTLLVLVAFAAIVANG